MTDAAATTPPEASPMTPEEYAEFCTKLLHGTADQLVKAGCTEFMLVGFNPTTQRAVLATNRGGSEDKGLSQMIFMLGVAQQCVISRINQADPTKAEVYDTAEQIGKVLQETAAADRKSRLN